MTNLHMKPQTSLITLISNLGFFFATSLFLSFLVQSILLMLGSPASPRKRPFELLSDLVDDGGLGEDLHAERWDVSALDEMSRYTKLGLGVASEDAVLMGRWGRSREEDKPPERTTKDESVGVGRGQDGDVRKEKTVEVFQSQVRQQSDANQLFVKNL